jgi:hypothetical protein
MGCRDRLHLGCAEAPDLRAPSSVGSRDLSNVDEEEARCQDGVAPSPASRDDTEPCLFNCVEDLVAMDHGIVSGNESFVAQTIELPDQVMVEEALEPRIKWPDINWKIAPPPQSLGKNRLGEALV